MKNFKKLSLTLLILPILFVGCLSEKTASIKPEITLTKTTKVSKAKVSKAKEIQKVEEITTPSKEEQLMSSAIFGGEIKIDDENENILLTKQTLTLTNSDEAFSKEEELLETARTFLGVKYSWAANGPFAFDCSGFTKYVFNKIGISLPRHSGHQANIGKKIKFSELQKGDLVFFDTTKEFRKKVNHVGIFIGDNKFIHASSGGEKVMITSFSKKKFYKNKFLYARRVVNYKQNFALNKSVSKEDSLIN